MRHFRMPNHSINTLTILQKHIGSILKEINKFEVADRKKAPINGYKAPSNSRKSVRHTHNSGICIKKSTENNRKLKSKSHICETSPKKNKVTFGREIAVKQRVYLCRTCNIGNRTKATHLKHLNTHEGCPLSCIRCKRSFKNKDSFEWHLSQLCYLKTRKKRSFKCSECSQEFRIKSSLEKHLEGHRRNRCPYCNKTLTRRKWLVQHLVEFHGIKLETDSFRCDECGKRFVKKQSLYYHLQQHLNDKIVCLECGNISHCKDAFKEHLKKHNEEKKFSCPICNARFLRKQHYVHHIRGHSLYKCITCSESFGSRLKAIRHKQKHHDVEGLHPRYICPSCPSVYHQKYKLQFHMKKHEGIGPSIFCKYCKKSFDPPSAYYKHCLLVNHVKHTTEAKKYTCELCIKQFSKKYLLAKHYFAIHKVVKEPFKCSHCNYTTVYKHNYERHVELHTNIEKTYMCEQCAKIFASLASLKDHISYNHVQNKKFECEECGKSFKRVSELTRHRSTHSDSRPFTCSICSTSFKRKTHLQRHEKSIHQTGKELTETQNQNIHQMQSDKMTHSLSEKIPQGQDNSKTLEHATVSCGDTLYTLQPLQPMLYSKAEDLTFVTHESLTEQQFFIDNVSDTSYEFLLDLTIPSQSHNDIINSVDEFGC